MSTLGSTAIEGWGLLSKNQIAHAWGVSRDTVARLMSGVEPDGQKQGHPAWQIRTAARYLAPYDLGISVPTDEDGQIDPERMEPKDRKDWYDGETRRIQLEVTKGRLAPVADYREKLADILDPVKTFVLTVPDIIEREAGLTREQAAAAVVAGERLLEDFHRKLTET